ncbi:hypothetical protein Sjap_013500 [Stephania japonica]|uniref:Uncharacterized protein n=1 Tax=Stephania japonica TaxID=461633 RepID=A0AAP0IY74_9MAGN
MSKPRDSLSSLMKLTLSLSIFTSLALLLLHIKPAPQQYTNKNFIKFLHQTPQDAHPERPIQRQTDTNISHIVFGIGGTAKNWKYRSRYTEVWWQSNVTRGFAWLDEPLNLTESSTRSFIPVRVSEDTSRFKFTCSYGSRSAVRIARIVLESFKLGMEDVRWFVMGDDDTVFFMENLVDLLSKYDHNQMVYIGGNSESVEQDVIHSYGMAYGGGGFAISYPLAKELVPVLDGCIDRYHYFFGSDERVGACVAEIGVRTIHEPGFHQVDIRGSAYGLLSAHPTTPLVSLHHLDYVEPLIPNKTREDSLRALHRAYKRDPARALQKSVCYDLQRNWSVSVSWGYTVQIHSRLITAKELLTPLQTFRSWRSWSEGPFTFNTREESDDTCEREIRYFVSDVEGDGEGHSTSSVYKRFDEGEREGCGDGAVVPKSVDVAAVKMDPLEWIKFKAPRRHCCEVINEHEEETESSVLQVRIRKCKLGESLTLPPEIS